MFKLPAKSKTLIISILAIYIAVIITHYNYYKNTVAIIEAEHRAKINLIEQSIFNETKYTEIISKIAEKDMENTLRDISRQLLALYELDPDVLAWDLPALRSQFEAIDIYIIDEQLTVIAASIEEEVGLSFESFPSFSKTLKNRLQGDQFRSDSINYSFMESELKKYSYMPTPDHKYLIELSVNIREQYPEMESLDIVYLSQSLKHKFPFIENISVYKYDVDTKKAQVMFKDHEQPAGMKFVDKNEELIELALETIESQAQVVDTDSEKYIIKYIPYYVMKSDDHRLNWWGTYIIEVIYTEHDLISAIAKQKYIFAQSMLLLSVLYFGFLFAIIYTIQKNREASYTDYLTKLPNRKRFEEFMGTKIGEANRRNTKIAVFFFDLDGFKAVNDNYGHNVGDQLLQAVGERLRENIPKHGIICRMGGDEFVGAIPGITSEAEVEKYAAAMSAIFEEEFDLGDRNLGIQSSIGVCIYPDAAGNVEKLITKADTAMYHAKQNKLGCSMYFSIT